MLVTLSFSAWRQLVFLCAYQDEAFIIFSLQ